MNITFTYSAPYDRMLTLMSNLPYSDEQILEAKVYIKNLEGFWVKHERKIIKETEKITKLRFRHHEKCYVVKNMDYEALSHPFTIKMDSDLEWVKLKLIHELIHILLVQNPGKVKILIKSLHNIYPNKDLFFKVHIPLCLIERKVVEKLYGKSYFKKVLKKEILADEEDEVWPIANKLYPQFEGDIIKFFKNVMDRKV